MNEKELFLETSLECFNYAGINEVESLFVNSNSNKFVETLKIVCDNVFQS